MKATAIKPAQAADMDFGVAFVRNLSAAFRQKAEACEAGLSGPGPSEKQLPKALRDLAAALRRCAAVYRAAADHVDDRLARGAFGPGGSGLATPKARRLFARLAPAEKVVSAAHRHAVECLGREPGHG